MKCSRHYFGLTLLGIILMICSCSKSNSGFNPQGGNLPSRYVYILDSAFNPASLTVATGSSISFVNISSIPHTIVSDDTTTFASQGLAPGTSFFYRNDTTGTFGYHCKDHPNVRGTITFTP